MWTLQYVGYPNSYASAERLSPLHLNLFFRVKAAPAHSTRPVVFAIHPRALGEPYSAHSLDCGFSEVTHIDIHAPSSLRFIAVTHEQQQ
jgi:hypothetical protein